MSSFIQLLSKHTRWWIALHLTVASVTWASETAPADGQTSENLDLLEVPEMSPEEMLDKQKNLARWHMGATMYDASEDYLNPVTWQEAEQTDNMGALMTEDPVASYDVPAGTFRFVIDLGDFFVVERFNFKNFTAQGSVALHYSDSLDAPNANSWKEAAPAISFDRNQILSPAFAPFEARYLMAVLQINRGGVIGNLGAFGNLSVAEVRFEDQDRDEDIAANTGRAVDSQPVKFDYASIHAKSRVSYVSSGQPPKAVSMIDDDIETFYEFEEGEEENVVIVDLSDQREVNRVSMLFESPPGEFDFYVVNKLPKELEDELKKQNAAAGDDMAMIHNAGRWEPLLLAQLDEAGEALSGIADFAASTFIHTIQLPGDFFQSISPTVVEQVDGSNERVRLDFANLSGRYLIVRFTPAGPGGGLKIYEISLMGDLTHDERMLGRAPAFEFFVGGGTALAPEPTQATSEPLPPANVRPPQNNTPLPVSP